MNSLHLFAGIGGGILADKILGHRIVGAVEIEPYCRAVLKQRQEEGLLETFPLFDDIRTFNGDEITERVDLVCGGFPCQDISTAGKGAGITGQKSGLFYELIRVCRTLRPSYIFLENSPAITGRGLGACLNEIAKIGYDAEWFTLSAGECGAPHLRNRWWCLCQRQDSDADRERELQPERLVEDLRRRFSYLGQENGFAELAGSDPYGEECSCGNVPDAEGNGLYLRRTCSRSEEGIAETGMVCESDGRAGEDTDAASERCESSVWERLSRYAPSLYCELAERVYDRLGDDCEERGGGEIADSDCSRRDGDGNAVRIEEKIPETMATRESRAETASQGIGDDSLSRRARDSADSESQRRAAEDERDRGRETGTAALVSRSTFSDAGSGGDSPQDGGRKTTDAASMGRDKGSDAEEHRRGNQEGFSPAGDSGISYFPGWWEIEPPLGRVANGVPNRVDRLKGLGNAQVPVCAALAFYLLLRRYCD